MRSKADISQLNLPRRNSETKTQLSATERVNDIRKYKTRFSRSGFIQNIVSVTENVVWFPKTAFSFQNFAFLFQKSVRFRNFQFHFRNAFQLRNMWFLFQRMRFELCGTIHTRSLFLFLKQRRYERPAACHKPVIPVVTFLTPLAWNAQRAECLVSVVIRELH